MAQMFGIEHLFAVLAGLSIGTDFPPQAASDAHGLAGGKSPNVV
jgi:hypothetical protein